MPGCKIRWCGSVLWVQSWFFQNITWSGGLKFYYPVYLLIHIHGELFLYELSVRIVPLAPQTKLPDLYFTLLSFCFSLVFLASESFIDFWRCSIPPMKCFLPYFIQCLGYFETGGGILVILLNTITRNVISPTKNVNMLLCYWKWGQAIGHESQ